MCSATSAPTAIMTNVRMTTVSLISIRDFKKPQPTQNRPRLNTGRANMRFHQSNFGWKGEYEPQRARREKQHEGHGDQIDAVPDDGPLAAKRRRKFHARHSRQNIVARQGRAFSIFRVFSKVRAFSIRQSHVILSKNGHRRFRAEQIIELGKLNLVIEAVVGNPMHQHGHPP